MVPCCAGCVPVVPCCPVRVAGVADVPEGRLSEVGIAVRPGAPPCGVEGCVAGAGVVPRPCWSACVEGCTLCSVCPCGVMGRALEPGSVAGACGWLAEGATLVPLVEAGGAVVDDGGVFAEGAGVTGALCGAPG